MSKSTRPSSFLSFFRDDFRMESWLLAGASVQAIAFLAIGRPAVVLLTALVLYQLLVYALKDQGWIDRHSRAGVYWGKWSTQIPHQDGTPSVGPGEEAITVFVLAARSNHPRGRFAPGFGEIGRYFGDMWRDCLKHRATNGFLGKTSTLIGTDQDCNNSMYWISYWKNLDALQTFANSPVHRHGLRWYLGTAFKKYPDIGILHETYTIPAGHWETILLNSKPFGLAATKHFGANDEHHGPHEVEILVNADRGPRWNTMADRMGRTATVA